MKRLLYYLLVAVYFVASCEKVSQKDGYVNAPTIIASQEINPDTKTLLSVTEGVGTIYWQPTEDINVFYGATNVKYTSTNTENVTVASFETTAVIGASEGASTNIWGLYPYSSEAVCDGSKVTTTISSAQLGVPETFDKNLFTTLAHSSSKELHFFNVCGGIKFSLSRSDIKKITFKGNKNEALAGKVNLSFVNNVPAATVVEASTQITLIPKDSDTFKKDVNYYIITLPVSLKNGFTIVFETATQKGTFNYNEKAVTISRSVFGKKAEIDKYAEFVDSIPDGLVDMGLSVLWASCNLGASKETDSGNYYAWGETETKQSFTKKSYKYFHKGNSPESYYATKYCPTIEDGYLGYTDSFTVLTPEDDAATLLLGTGWRIPTMEEYQELVDNCTFTKVSNGWKVKSNVNGNSIFFPAVGYKQDGGFSSGFCCYWSSSLHVPYSNAYLAYFNDYASPKISANYYQYSRVAGMPIRPVYSTQTVGITDLTLDKSSISVFTRRSQQLHAEVIKTSAAVNEYIEWSSSDPSIATVDYQGNVFGVTPGTATISAKIVFTSIVKTCEVTVTQNQLSTNSHEYVDLGLSALWATTNIGASSPEGFGDYFAWGDTSPYYSSLSPLVWKADKTDGYVWGNYKHCKGSETTLTRYCDSSSSGYDSYTDDYTELLLEDDAAHVNWGGDWHIPSYFQIVELARKCKWEKTTLNSVEGFLVTGPNGNSIFLPNAGYYEQVYFRHSDIRDMRYWTNTLYRWNSSEPDCAWVFAGSEITYNGVTYINGSRGNYWRQCGLVIRPVCW